MFCSQISLVLKAAIPMEEGIAAICETMEDSRDQALLKQLQDSVAMTGSFYTALEESKRFPPYMVNMVRIGEKAGKLDDVTASLAAYYEREDQLRSQIKSAVTYPLILILMISAVIAVLVIKVLPVFQQVFENLGSDMSASSITAMNIGGAIGKYAFFVILGVVLLAVACFAASKTTKGAIFFANLAEKLPFIRKISDKIGAARFASVMSMLLGSGYDTTEALELLPGVLGSPKVIKKSEACRIAIEEGKSFSKALEENHMFSGIYSSMINVGARTGNIDSVMDKLADHYNEEVDTALSNAVSFIEPIMVGLLSVIIGAILLSIMLPLMGIMSSIG